MAEASVVRRVLRALRRSRPGNGLEPAASVWLQDGRVERVWTRSDDAIGWTDGVGQGPGEWIASSLPSLDAIELAAERGLRRLVVLAEQAVLPEHVRRVLGSRGIPVRTGVADEAAFELRRAWAFGRRHGRPLITLKVATSLDGRIATRTGDSRWITGARARRRARSLRFDHDVVAVGVQTVLEDDPRLLTGFRGREPLRLVLDSLGRTPTNGRLAATLAAGPVAVATVSPAPHLARAGFQVWSGPAGPDGRVDLAWLIDELHRRGHRSLWVEGGGQLHGSLLDGGWVDRVEWFLAPLVVGGSRSRAAVAGVGPERIQDALRLEAPRVRRVGPDLWLSAWVQGRRPPSG